MMNLKKYILNSTESGVEYVPLEILSKRIRNIEVVTNGVVITYVEPKEPIEESEEEKLKAWVQNILNECLFDKKVGSFSEYVSKALLKAGFKVPGECNHDFKLINAFDPNEESTYAKCKKCHYQKQVY